MNNRGLSLRVFGGDLWLVSALYRRLPSNHSLSSAYWAINLATKGLPRKLYDT